MLPAVMTQLLVLLIVSTTATPGATRVMRDAAEVRGLALPRAEPRDPRRQDLSSNPDAVRLHWLGLEALRVGDPARATDLLTRAVEADPDFALAHLDLALAWRVLGHDDESQAHARRALELSSSLPRDDQLAIQGTYDEVMSDFPKAVEAFQSLWTLYPHDVSTGLKLFHAQVFAGQLDDAGRVVDEMKTLTAADRDVRVMLAEAEWLSRVGRLSDALSAADAAVSQAKLANAPRLLAMAMMTDGRAKQRLGHSSGAAMLFAEAKQVYATRADAGGVSDALRGEAVVLLGQNSVQTAFERVDEALREATAIHDSRSIVECWIVRANALRRLRRLADSHADAESAVAASRKTGYRSALGRALVALGSTERAERDPSNARAHLEEAERIGRAIGETGVTDAAVNAQAALGRERRDYRRMSARPPSASASACRWTIFHSPSSRRNTSVTRSVIGIGSGRLRIRASPRINPTQYATPSLAAI